MRCRLELRGDAGPDGEALGGLVRALRLIEAFDMLSSLRAKSSGEISLCLNLGRCRLTSRMGFRAEGGGISPPFNRLEQTNERARKSPLRISNMTAETRRHE